MSSFKIFKRTGQYRGGAAIIKSVTKGGVIGDGSEHCIVEIQGGAKYVGPSEGVETLRSDERN